MLVLATVAAFFVAQRMKHSKPLVYAVHVTKFISPNKDHVSDRGKLRFRIKQKDIVTVEVVDADGRVVRVLARAQRLPAGPHRFSWNGRFLGGSPAPDGSYQVRIVMRRAGRAFVPNKSFRVDTAPPRLVVRQAAPATIAPARAGVTPVLVRYRGVPIGHRAEFLVYRVRGGQASTRPVASFLGSRLKRAGEWQGTVGDFQDRSQPCVGRANPRGRARPAPSGDYLIVVRACDGAGNLGSAPSRLPPRRGDVRGKPGVTVRYLAATPASLAVRSGQIARVPVESPLGRFRFRLQRVGGGPVVARGEGRGPVLRFRVPKLGSGLYVVTLRSNKEVAGVAPVARTPLVVRGSRGGRVLVVLPAFAWQAASRVDMTRDGFADTLSDFTGRQQTGITLKRAIPSGALPPGFAQHEAALLAFLDRSGIKYEVTTDIDLAERPAVFLQKRRAVVFAGDQRWLSPSLGLALRHYTEDGGRVASFSSDSFRRTAGLVGARIVDPSPRSARDIFGESIDQQTVTPAPAVPFASKVPLFAGPIGLFTEFEQSRDRASGSQLLTSAGRDPGQPAVVVYRLGRGQVTRVGAPQWSAGLLPASADASVAAATLSLWRYLAR